MTDAIHGWEAAYRKRPSGECRPHQDAEFLDRFFREHAVSKILDLGCGDGRHLVYFAKRGYRMYGLDIAPTGIQLSEEWLSREGLSAELVTSDMTDIPWPDSLFDATICVQVINHHRIREIRQTIQEVYRTLRPGGHLFLTVSTTQPVRSAADSEIEEVEPNTYVWAEGHERGVPHHYFDMDELQKEFRVFRMLDLHRDARGKACMLAQKPHRSAHRTA